MNHASALVSVSRRDLRNADRAFKRFERATLTAERRCLLRASNNVRSMSIAALRGRKSRRTGLPAMAPLDKSWRALEHPSLPMGGILADKSKWHITAPDRHSREVDIAPRLQPLLERWEFADRTRAASLQNWISAIMGDAGARHRYHRFAANNPPWPRDPSMLPPVLAQPERNFRKPVEDYADAHMAEWFEKIWASYARRG